MSILECKDVLKTYGRGENQVNALNGVNFSMEKGEFAAIVGPSGSGKSTLLHLIGGLDMPTSGTVRIENQETASLKPKDLALFRRRQVGIVFQSFNLIPTLTVEQNITLPVRLDGRKPDEQYLEKLCRAMHIENKRKAMPHQLSGGQAQRVAIARALMAKPALVLADEPTGSLDSKNARETLELLKSTCRKLNQTLLLVTHDPNMALQADRILVVEDGQIVRDEQQNHGAGGHA